MPSSYYIKHGYTASLIFGRGQDTCLVAAARAAALLHCPSRSQPVWSIVKCTRRGAVRHRDTASLIFWRGTHALVHFPSHSQPRCTHRSVKTICLSPTPSSGDHSVETSTFVGLGRLHATSEKTENSSIRKLAVHAPTLDHQQQSQRQHFYGEARAKQSATGHRPSRRNNLSRKQADESVLRSSERMASNGVQALACSHSGIGH